MIRKWVKKWSHRIELLKRFVYKDDFGTPPSFARPAIITSMVDGKIFFRDPYFKSKYYYISLRDNGAVDITLNDNIDPRFGEVNKTMSKIISSTENFVKTKSKKVRKNDERNNTSRRERDETSTFNKCDEQKPTPSGEQTDDRISDRKTS